MSVTLPMVMSQEPRLIQSSGIEPTPPGARLPRNTVEHPAHPKFRRIVADGVDRLERVVAPVHVESLNAEQDAGERRDGRHRERIELGAEDAGCRAKPRRRWSDCDEPSSGFERRRLATISAAITKTTRHMTR
jgi:hypothetical protein